MDLAERLRRLGYTPSAGTPEPPRAKAGLPVEAVLRGGWEETAHGRCYVGRAVYRRTHVHGGVSLDGVFGLDGDLLAILARSPEFRAIDFERVVFLDTETTGLAGGTGTYVFLVGLGYFHGDEFRVDQFFMADFGQERALLSALGEALSRFDTLVTFNGKAFDWPLLQTRYALARQRLAVPDPRHLDLLFPARRLWRERVGSCSLSSLESSVLAVRRELDVPGWLIPSMYFDFVRAGDAGPLRPVFAHNEQDILSLLALTVRLGQSLADPTDAAVDPIDVFSMGRVFEASEEWERAALCYEEALARPLPSRTREQVACRLGLTYKRLRRSANALAVWESLVGRPGGVGVTPFVELAKHLEHVDRDYGGAIAIVERAIDRIEARAPTPFSAVPSRERAELSHRLRRLREKHGRLSARKTEVAGDAGAGASHAPSTSGEFPSALQSEESWLCG